MEKDLTCTMCSQQYRDTNVPRLLPKCGHSFCESCIKSNLQPMEDSENVKITCPEDGTTMTFEDRDINNFPKNIALVKLLTKDSKKKDESFKDGSLNESNIAKHSAHELDEEDNELVAVINESTKGTDNNGFGGDPSAEIDLEMDDTCLIHQKPLEIVCIRDRTKICSTCAIFGDHKGHEFKSMDEVAKDKEKRCDEILQLIDRKEALQTKICGKEAKDEVTRTLIARKDGLCKEVKQKFARLSDLLKTAEKRTLDKIIKNMGSIEERLMEEMKVPEQLTKKYAQWEERAYRQINCFDGDNFEDQLQVLNYERSKEQPDVMEEGNRIIDEISKVVATMEEQRSQVVNGVSLEFNNELEKKIQDIVVVKEPGKKQPTAQITTAQSSRQSAPAKFKDIYEPVVTAPPKRSLTQQSQPPPSISVKDPSSVLMEFQPPMIVQKSDDFLLETHQEPIFEEEPVVREVHEPPLNIPSIAIKEPEVLKPPTTYIISPTNGMGQTSRTITDKSSMKESSFVFERAPVKKKPKLKLPEKYEKLLDSIIADQVETADFTNAELGDQVMVQIAEYIRGKKIKTLKLIRNKLTDEALDKMLPHFGGIITLNLSQNLLTDRFIDHLLNHLPRLPLLKSIILSQNKIKERSVKTRLEEIKKYEIVVSL